MVIDSRQAGAQLTEEVRESIQQTLAVLIERELWDWLEDRVEGNEGEFAAALAAKIVERVSPEAPERS